MFKSISVSSRLITVTCLLFAFALGTGLMGLKGMRDNNLVLSSVYRYEVTPLNDLRALDILVHNGLVRPVDRLLFKQINWAQCLTRVNESIQEMNKRWHSLQQIKITDTNWVKGIIPLSSLSKLTLGRLSVILQDQDRAKLDVFSDKFLVPLADRYSEVTESLTQNRLAAMDRQYQEAQRHYQWARNILILSLTVGALVAGIIIFMLIRSINKPLVKLAMAVKKLMNGDFSHRLSYDGDDEFGILIRGFNKTMDDLGGLIATVEKSGIQVTSSITEIAASAKQQEATVNEHAATSNEIAASTTEIAATSENLMDTMSKVTDMVHNTTMAASQSHKRLQNINRIMKKMENAVNSIVGKLSILNDKADNIALVTKTINKIADQTNLLSLNAAIEAEKAGEYGAGFSVVSSEIRRLADQTAVATFDIEQTVNEVQAAVNSGVMSIEKFADNVHRGFSDIQISSNQISEVITQVEALRPPIETVNEGIEAQFMGAKQISEAVSQLNEAAQQIAETVGQSSSAIDQLSMATDTLRNSVSQFNLKGGSSPSDSPDS